MKKKRLHTNTEYETYMKAYDKFYNKRKAFGKKSFPKLDSQFSESIAADYFDFDLIHKNGFDGCNSNGETCEVKGTGYNNARVRFTNAQQKADHIYWVQAVECSQQVIIQEIDLSKCGSEFNKDGFIALGKKNSAMKIIKTYSLYY